MGRAAPCCEARPLPRVSDLGPAQCSQEAGARSRSFFRGNFECQALEFVKFHTLLASLLFFATSRFQHNAHFLACKVLSPTSDRDGSVLARALLPDCLCTTSGRTDRETPQLLHYWVWKQNQYHDNKQNCDSVACMGLGEWACQTGGD